MEPSDLYVGRKPPEGTLRSSGPEPFLFERNDPKLGRLSLRRLQLVEDMQIVHAWVCGERARYWGMMGRSLEEVTAEYRAIAARSDVYLGYHGADPTFLLECYAPGDHPVGRHYAVQPGDRGMHVLVGPPKQAIQGFTWGVFSAAMDFMFSDRQTHRVVVEPDIRNRKIHVLNRRAGFRYQKFIELPGKRAHLAFCTRAQYEAAQRGSAAALVSTRDHQEASLIAHLRPDIWMAVNTALIRKAIAELAHERLLAPSLEVEGGDWGCYVLEAEERQTKYRFGARVLELHHWDIDRTWLEKTRAGDRVPLDAVEFVLEFSDRIGIPPDMLPVYLEEITSTLYGAAYKRAREESTAADLVHASFQEIETEMTEGHPAFIANSGRVGFDAADYLAYAPEAGSPVHLVWLAAHRRCTEFSCVDDLSYARLITEELGADEVRAFDGELERKGLDPASYLLVPVHPWQWFNKLAMIFAPDIAAGDLVCLGVGKDEYRAQQSVRTFFNCTYPHKRYVKTALSILNMGFMRGLSLDYMRATPAINQWIDELIGRDAYLREKGFTILREAAAVGYRSPRFESLAKSSPYRKMLAALWRDSPVPRLANGQRLMTMAALLHRDRAGAALLPQLIQSSGVDADTWLARYLDAYLAPLVHCFYRYDLAFMPHGENVILVLEDNVPVKVILKDIAEEAIIMDAGAVVPTTVSRLSLSVPEHVKVLSIFTDVFDGILRHLAQIMVEQGAYTEERFWRRVGDCLRAYQEAHPELRDKFARYDLFAPEFLHSCLNRLQLSNNLQMIDIADPAKNLRFAGTLKNPVAPFREGSVSDPNEPRIRER
jgi:siderophore synthetase component